MFYRLSADAVLVIHLGFIVFVLVGGFLALRWRRVPILHLPTVAWGIYIELSGNICPLTPLENNLRAAAGDSGYEGGFIEHYILAVVYPDGLTHSIQMMLAGVVVVTNLVAYGLVLRKMRRKPCGKPKADASRANGHTHHE